MATWRNRGDMQAFQYAVKFFALFLVTGSAMAQNNCDKFANAIEDSVKEISFFPMEGVGDNSAPRATNRRLGQVFHMGMIQSNMALMQASKCPLPTLPVTEKAYRGSASSCAIALARASGSEPPQECDRAKWVRAK